MAIKARTKNTILIKAKPVSKDQQVIPVLSNNTKSSDSAGAVNVNTPLANILDSTPKASKVIPKAKDFEKVKVVVNDVTKQTGKTSFSKVLIDTGKLAKITNTNLKKSFAKTNAEKLGFSKNLSVKNTNQKKINIDNSKSKGQPRFVGPAVNSKNKAQDKENLQITTFSEQGPLFSSENSIIFNDSDSKNKYSILQEIGLNVLRGEIIASMEYIPLNSSKDGDASLLQKRYLQSNGTNNSKIVRNSSRLIELHRQIRNYIMTTAKKVFEKTFGDMYSEEIIETIRESVSFYFNDSSGLELQNLLSSLQSSTLEGQNNKSKVDIVAEQIILRDIDDPSKSDNFKSIVTNNKTSQFLREVYSSLIYEFLIDAFVGYSNRIANLDNKIKNIWKADKCIAKNASNYIKIMGYDSTIYDESNFYKNENNLNSELFSNFTGILRQNQNSDLDILYNLLTNIYSHIDFRDSVYSFETLSSSPTNKKIIDRGMLRFGISNDLGDYFSDIKNFRLSDFICNLGNGTSYMRLGQFDSDRYLTSEKFYNLFSSLKKINNDDNLLDTDIIESKEIATGEALVGLIYDYTLDMFLDVNGSLPLDLSTDNNNSFLSFKNNGILGIDYANNSLNTIKNAKMIPKVSYDAIKLTNLGIYGSSTNTTRQSILNPFPVINLESTKNVVGTERYVPGASFYGENFINIGLSTALGIDGQELNSQRVIKDKFNNFSNDYLNNTCKLAGDMSSIFPSYLQAEASNGVISKDSLGGKMSAKHRLISLMTLLKNDLEKILSDTSRIPLLATFLSQGINEDKAERQRNTFLAMFWGMLSSGKYRRLYSNGGEYSSLDLDTRNALDLNLSPMLSSLTEYYNEYCLQKFLIEECGMDLSLSETAQFKSLPKFSNEQKSYKTFLFQGNINSISNASSNNEIEYSVGISPYNAKITSDSQNVLNFDCAGNDEIKSKLAIAFGDGGINHLRSVVSKYLSDVGDTSSFGLYRLFEESFTAASFHLDFSNPISNSSRFGNFNGSFKIETGSNYNLFKNIAGSLDNVTWNDASNELSNQDYKSSKGFLRTHMHHNSLIWYKWLSSFINDILTTSISISPANNSINIKVFGDQILGIIDGINEAILLADQKNIDLSQFLNDNSANEFERAKYLAKAKILGLFNIINGKRKHLGNSLAVLVNHSVNLFSLNLLGDVNYNDKIDEFEKLASFQLLNIQPKSEKEILLFEELNYLNDQSLSYDSTFFKRIIGLTNKLTPGQIVVAKNRRYDFNDDLIPKGLKFRLNKNRLMHKVFSQENYGFLVDEKRGLKTILNIGIPAGMIEVMQKNAYQETGDPKFLDSNYICVTINKKNHLVEENIYCPKRFIFDASAYILDENINTKEESFHLKNFSDENGFDKLLTTLEVTRINADYEKTQPEVSLGYSGIANREMLENHLIDYCLKEYIRSMSGLNFNEETFLLNETPSLSSEGMEIAHNNILNTILEVYPQVNEDPQLKNEVYRLLKIIKQTVPFSSKNNFIKTCSGNKFDRVFSIIVNEKDFVLSKLGEKGRNIFVGLPNFTLGSTLERPDQVDLTALSSVLSILNKDNDSNDSSNRSRTKSDQELIDIEDTINESLGEVYKRNNSSPAILIDQYVKSLDDNSPEVYNYSINVMLLPRGFEKYSDGKVSDEKKQNEGIAFNYATADSNKR